MKFNTYGRTDITPFTISQADIDEVMERARAERAEVMHAALGKMAAWSKALFGRHTPPNAGAWA
jgi:hypothetical protein